VLSEDNPILAFNKAIIDATRKYSVAYKPNFAFYEAYGKLGYEALEETIKYIGKEHFIIADAKRGDIGNTSKMYAKAAFEQLGADAITIAPYMGKDSILPFLEYQEKWAVVLGLTSNQGSHDFQMHKDDAGIELYQTVLHKVASWTTAENTMFVIGATHPEAFKVVRSIVPEHFLLVPGVGEQGGELAAVYHFGRNQHVGLLVNASRSILFASNQDDFASQAGKKAEQLQQEMQKLLYLNA
jgi:orotidine-5'-phosphate decarboxylase